MDSGSVVPRRWRMMFANSAFSFVSAASLTSLQQWFEIGDFQAISSQNLYAAISFVRTVNRNCTVDASRLTTTATRADDR